MLIMLNIYDTVISIAVGLRFQMCISVENSLLHHNVVEIATKSRKAIIVLYTLHYN